MAGGLLGKSRLYCNLTTSGIPGGYHVSDAAAAAAAPELEKENTHIRQLWMKGHSCSVLVLPHSVQVHGISSIYPKLPPQPSRQVAIVSSSFSTIDSS